MFSLYPLPVPTRVFRAPTSTNWKLGLPWISLWSLPFLSFPFWTVIFLSTIFGHSLWRASFANILLPWLLWWFKEGRNRRALFLGAFLFLFRIIPLIFSSLLSMHGQMDYVLIPVIWHLYMAAVISTYWNLSFLTLGTFPQKKSISGPHSSVTSYKNTLISICDLVLCV